MHKETITFHDFDGNEITQDFYFNFTKTELSIMEVSQKGGLIAFANKISNEQDGEKVMQLFQKLILDSYGIKSSDGIHFLKEDPIDHHKYADEFKQCEAYDVLFMKLAQDADAAADFFNGIIPADAQQQIENMKDNEELPGQKNYSGPEVSSAIVKQISDNK